MAITVDPVALSSFTPDIGASKTRAISNSFDTNNAERSRSDEERRDQIDYQSFQSWLQQNQNVPVQRPSDRTSGSDDSKIQAAKTSSDAIDEAADREEALASLSFESKQPVEQASRNQSDVDSTAEAAVKLSLQEADTAAVPKATASSEQAIFDTRLEQTQAIENRSPAEALTDLLHELSIAETSVNDVLSTVENADRTTLESLQKQITEAQPASGLVAGRSGTLSISDTELLQTDVNTIAGSFPETNSRANAEAALIQVSALDSADIQLDIQAEAISQTKTYSVSASTPELSGQSAALSVAALEAAAAGQQVQTEELHQQGIVAGTTPATTDEASTSATNAARFESTDTSEQVDARLARPEIDAAVNRNSNKDGESATANRSASVTVQSQTNGEGPVSKMRQASIDSMAPAAQPGSLRASSPANASATAAEASTSANNTSRFESTTANRLANATFQTQTTGEGPLSKTRQALIDSVAPVAQTGSLRTSSPATGFAAFADPGASSPDPLASVPVTAGPAETVVQATSLPVVISRVDRPTPLLHQVMTAVTENANMEEQHRTITVSLRDPHFGELKIQLEKHNDSFSVKVAAGNDVTFAMLSSRTGELADLLRANDIELREITQIDAETTNQSAFAQTGSEKRDQRSAANTQQQTRRFAAAQKNSSSRSADGEVNTATTVSFRA